MVPAGERLETCDRAILQAHDGLIEDSDFLAFERAPQLGFEREPVGLACAHRRFEYFDAVPAETLGVVHGEFRVLEDLLGPMRLIIGERKPDRGRKEDLA